MAVSNPYQGIDWGTVQHVSSICHDHSVGSRFQPRYDVGVRHFAFSEYERSVPSDDPQFPEDYYGCGPAYPLSRWVNEPPGDVIASPNAEHWGAATFGGGAHILSVGSFLGTVGFNGEHFTGWTENAAVWDEGADEIKVLTEAEFFAGVVDQLQYQDGGGVYRAHTRQVSEVIRMLDAYPEIMRGMSLYNDRRVDGGQGFEFPPARGYYLHEWDEVLKTGRRCFAVAETDRGQYGSVNLLLPAFTEQEAARAYRNGNFYSKIRWTDLRFTEIVDDGSGFSVETEEAALIRIITEKGVVAESDGNTLEYTYPTDSLGQPDLTFVRAEAWGGSDPDPEGHPSGRLDEAYTNAVMHRTPQQVANIARRRRVLRLVAVGF